MLDGPASQSPAQKLFQAWLDRRVLEGAEPDPAELCIETPDLLPELQSLIDGYRVIDQVLPSPSRVNTAQEQVPATPPAITGYQIGELIGEGGMGEVWQAEQQVPVRRSVALKVIKPRPDLDRVHLRFEFERQAQAAMEHPAIARIFDAGVTDDGRPFFSMERIQGLPITRYCDQQRLTVRHRLELFAQVCDGVLHAHQKGLIHRDLKPSNILIAETDGKPQPKIIDFGIAKAVTSSAEEPGGLTELGQLVGTPAYMSPEQASLSNADQVDTRSDVYSLGVVLYELLVGARPHAGPLEPGSRDTEPMTPSSRISELGDRAEEVARLRAVPKAQLPRLLRGDVDWIVLKALEPSREDRYGSPAELAEDLRRHFRDEPVWAGPAGAGYRLKKLMRRHRTAVGTAGLTLLALIGTLVGLGIGLERALKAEQKAVAESALAESTTEFLVKLFEGSDPTSRDPHPTARALLDQGATRIDQDLKDQPPLRARMLETMGRAYHGLGDFHEAADLLQEALAFRRAQDDDKSLELARTLYLLADIKSDQGHLEEAEKLASESLALIQNLTPEALLELAKRQQLIGVIYWRQRRLDEALELTRQALSTREEHLGSDHETLAPLLNNLANLEAQTGQPERTEELFRRALAILEQQLGAKHPDVASTLNNLAMFKGNRGDLETAAELHGQALEIRKAVLAPDHPDLGETYNNFGVVLTDLGRSDEAEAMMRQAIEIREKALGTEHFFYATSIFNLGRLYVEIGRLGPGREYTQRALDLMESHLGPENPMVAFPLLTLASIDQFQENYNLALERLQRCLKLREKFLDDHHPLVVPVLEMSRDVLLKLGRDDEAQALAERLVGAPSSGYEAP